MIGPGSPGESFTAYAQGYASGLVGTLTVRIEAPDGSTVRAPTTVGIVEVEAEGGYAVYSYVGLYPATLGSLVLIWFDGATEAAEDMLVDPDAPADDDIDGPCQPWIEGEALATACGAAAGSTDIETYAGAAEGAGNILFALSGRVYTGVCADTVRPCVGRCATTLCGCGGLSRVKLAGFPVREIISVKIDGDLVSDSLYRLDGRKWLTRLADADGSRAYWPHCQRLDVADTEDDTFSVRYFHGQDPPAEGIAAAYELGCELFRAGQGAADCKLPQGTVSVSKQGLSIDVSSVSVFLRQGQTGLPLVDIFLASSNPARKTRRSAFFSPDNQPYARRVG